MNGDTLMPIIVTAIVLFSMGMVGVIIRRNVLVILMSIELMLNAVNLSFVTFARMHGGEQAHVMVLMIYVVAAVEVAVAAAIIVNMFKLKRTVSIDRFDALKG